MILRVQRAEVIGPQHLRLVFNNGMEKSVDVTPLLQGAIFAPLRDADYFATGRLDTLCGTIAWPNGADFAPEALLALPALSVPVG